jgi:hypothetical protein
MMTKPPTETQRAILRAAAAHPHGLAAPPPHLPPAPRIAVAKALLGAGLLARAAGSEGTDPRLIPAALVADSPVIPSRRPV